MKLQNIESEITILLKFLQHEVETQGVSPTNIHFDFSLQRVQHYLNHPAETLEEGEDLTNFRKQSNLFNKSILNAIKAILIRSTHLTL